MGDKAERKLSSKNNQRIAYTLEKNNKCRIPVSVVRPLLPFFIHTGIKQLFVLHKENTKLF